MGRRVIGCVALLAMSVPFADLRGAEAQTASFDRHEIVIDPAHGGADAGGPIGDRIQEKDVTLAFAGKLRAVLARRFNVTLTRSGDLDGGGLDERAEVANRTHALACLVLHASTGTTGVVLGTSALGTALMRLPAGVAVKAGSSVPWNRAQGVYAVQSGKLANLVGTALARSSIPVTIMRVEMRPLDSLTCPAISVELGVLRGTGADMLPVSDAGYQQRVAESIADALDLWRNQAQPPDSLPAAVNAGLYGMAAGATP